MAQHVFQIVVSQSHETFKLLPLGAWTFRRGDTIRFEADWGPFYVQFEPHDGLNNLPLRISPFGTAERGVLVGTIKSGDTADNRKLFSTGDCLLGAAQLSREEIDEALLRNSEQFVEQFRIKVYFREDPARPIRPSQAAPKYGCWLD